MMQIPSGASPSAGHDEKLIAEEQESAKEKAAAGGPAPSQPAGGPVEMAADGPAPMPAGGKGL